MTPATATVPRTSQVPDSEEVDRTHFGLRKQGEIEDVGASLGMRSDEACYEFLALHGTLWTTRTGNMEASRITSDESRAYPPPRNWSAFDDVVLM